MATYFETFVDALAKCADPQGVLGEEWVLFPPNPDYGYDATPRNALTFAVMGVDGVHYAILAIDGAVTDESPVITVCPMDSETYSVLGDSFLRYLAIGCGVSEKKMGSIFQEERAGTPSLITFLRNRYVHKRFYELEPPPIENYIHLLEMKE